MPSTPEIDLTEGARADGDPRGRQADTPTQLTKKGWRDIAWRTMKEIKGDNVPLLAGGVAYYAMLALFPALIALVSIYGLVATPSEVTSQIESMTSAMPSEAANLITEQATAIAESSSSTLGLAAVLGALAAIWSASSGMRWLMSAISLAYDEPEERKFFKLRGTAVLLTFAAVVGAVVAIGLLVAMPSIFEALDLEGPGKLIVSVLRWPLLAGLLIAGLAVLYRYAPDRDGAKWRWVTTGSIAATAIWLLGSVALSIYASMAGKFEETYGSLGAVIVLMLWLYVSALAVLVGAELNAEMEHQTAKDTTKGPDRPMGQRHAEVADELGEPAPEKGRRGERTHAGSPS
jgi:membrane protein